jgi:hypothetical protein
MKKKRFCKKKQTWFEIKIKKRKTKFNGNYVALFKK